MDNIERDRIRDVAKRITKKRQANYIEGRLGLIIEWPQVKISKR